MQAHRLTFDLHFREPQLTAFQGAEFLSSFFFRWLQPSSPLGTGRQSDCPNSPCPKDVHVLKNTDLTDRGGGRGGENQKAVAFWVGMTRRAFQSFHALFAPLGQSQCYLSPPAWLARWGRPMAWCQIKVCWATLANPSMTQPLSW